MTLCEHHLRAPPRIPPFSMSPAHRQMGRTQRPLVYAPTRIVPTSTVTRPSFRARTRRCFTIAPHRMRYSLRSSASVAHISQRRARADNARVAHVAHRPSLPTHSTDVGRVRDDDASGALALSNVATTSRAAPDRYRSSIHKRAARTVDTSAPLTPLPNSGRSNMGSRTRPRSSRSRRRTRPRPSSCRPQRSRLASSRLRVTFVEPTTVSRCRDSLHPLTLRAASASCGARCLRDG